MIVLCIEIKEPSSLHVHIYIFIIVTQGFFIEYNPIEYEWFLNRSILLINGNVTGTITPG